MPLACYDAPHNDEAGFTLVELLVVLAALLVFTTLVLPRVEHLHIHADETSALTSMNLIHGMQGQYKSAYPDCGYADSLAALGGKAGTRAPGAQAAQLIPEDLASGIKSGYRFTLAGRAASPNHPAGYLLTAVPIRVGRSGESGFCSDESGQIRFDPKGGADCTEALQ